MIFEEKLVIVISIGLLIAYFLYRKNHKNKEHFVTNKSISIKKPLNTPLSNDFNLDNMCNTNKQYLGWKCWWKKTQQNKLNNIVDTQLTTHATKEPLLFDGIRKI